VQARAGSVDPQWTWYFQSPSSWLGSVLVLNRAPPPPVANFTATYSGLTFTFDASSSTAQSTATYG
jgi:hypothetical protein